MLRPASLLPALSQAFDAPLWPSGSLLPAGACYRALRRLPGRISHPLEQRVFQDAPCSDCSGVGRALSEQIAPLSGRIVPVPHGRGAFTERDSLPAGLSQIIHMSYTTNARFMGRPQALWQADCFSYLRKEQANENQDERKSWHGAVGLLKLAHEKVAVMES